MNKTEFQFMIFILTVLHACSSPQKKKKMLRLSYEINPKIIKEIYRVHERNHELSRGFC